MGGDDINNLHQIGLWRSTPTMPATLGVGTLAERQSKVFPSARTALVEGMRRIGLSRPHRVALPEFSSHCVISAVGSVATPIPMREVAEFDIPVSCVLIYEQWGWRYPLRSLEPLTEKYDRIIFDCVDSPDVFFDRTIDSSSKAQTIVLQSLSKCLGLVGGGVLAINGEMIAYDKSIDCDAKKEHALTSLGANFIKTYSQSTNHIDDWIEENDFEKALQQETYRRRQNVNLINNTALADNWPDWMRAAAESDCSAGILPLFRGQPLANLLDYKTLLEKALQIQSEIYNFNWNENPAPGAYEPCLAVPCHGEVDVSQLIDVLVP